MTEATSTPEMSNQEADLRLETVLKAIAKHPLTLAGWKKALPLETPTIPPQIRLENAQEMLQEMNALVPPTMGAALPDTIPSDKRLGQLVSQFCHLVRRVIPEATMVRMAIFAPSELRTDDIIRSEWVAGDINELQKSQADLSMLAELSNWLVALSMSSTEYVAKLQEIASKSIKVINQGDTK